MDLTFGFSSSSCLFPLDLKAKPFLYTTLTVGGILNSNFTKACCKYRRQFFSCWCSNVSELRLTVRSSLTKKEKKDHVHEFGPETYDEEEDMYSKTCKTCKHTVSYEKM